MGRAGREQVIAHWSVEGMVQGYEELIEEIYAAKCRTTANSKSETRPKYERESRNRRGK